MKSGLTVLVFILLLGFLAAGEVREIPFRDIEAIAHRQAKEFWGEVDADDAIPLYDRDGKLLAWQFNFSKGRAFPARDALLNRIIADDTNLFESKWATEEFGCMTLGARTDKPVIMGYADGLSYSYSYSKELQRLAGEKLGTKYEVKREVFVSFGSRWLQVSDGRSDYFVKALPPAQILSPEDFAEVVSFPEYPPKNTDYSQNWEMAMQGSTQSRETVYISYADHMPSIRWSYGCTPTAGAHVAAYWDNISMFRDGDYSTLVGATYSRIDPVTGEHCFHMPDALPLIADFMDTWDMGATMPWMVDDGMAEFFSYKGHDSWCFNNDFIINYFFDIDAMYSDLVREINASCPTIMGVWGHTVTGFGYSTTEQMVAIHNSNSPAIDNWHIDEFWQLAQIHPRPKAGCAINIVHPDGGQGWIDNGPGFETYQAGSIMEISWIGDFLPNTTVEILISPVSTYGVDDQWYEIAAAAPNTGSYSWQIPQHWQGEDYRIVLQVLDAEGHILGVDGSYGSFTIIPGGGTPDLIIDESVSMLMSPSYFRFTPTGSAWNAVGLRIPVSSDPAYNSLSRLSLYSPDFQELLVAGQPNYAKVNWLAMDKNHADWNFFGLKAEIQPFKSYNVLEHEGGLHTLALGANPGISWGSSDVCKIWDLELSPGFYRISLSNSQMADFGIGLCSSQGGTQNYITPATLMAFQDRTGLSTGESFIVEISQTDVYGFIAWSNNTFSGTISISIADPGYWTGALDTNWHNPGNWATGTVPDADADITIPGALARYPVVSNPATCASLFVANGGMLVLTNELSVTGLATISGILRFNGANPILSCNNDIIWTPTALLHEITSGIFNVGGNWIALDGAETNMNWSTVNFVGSNPARMQINSDLAAFKHLNISKSDGARIAIDEESTKNIVIRGNLTVNPGAVLRNSCDYDVVLYGNLSSSGGLIFENCALRMLNRTGNQSISLSGANRLYSLVIDSSYEVSLHSNLPLHGSMLIENGTFNAGNNVITVYGDWNNDAGLGSLIGNGHKVVFAGSYNADCDETGFDILELNKINGAELRVPPGATLACQSYDWSSGALRVLNNAQFIADDLADSSILGRYHLEGGLIELHQDGAQSVNLNADVYMQGGTFNVYGGSGQHSSWAHNRAIMLQLDGGILDFRDKGVLYASSAYNISNSIINSTIRTVGDFILRHPGFNPQSGVVELYGNQNALLRVYAPNTIHSLRIDKQGRGGDGIRQRQTPTVTVDVSSSVRNWCQVLSGTLVVNGATLSTAGYMQITGSLFMNSADDIISVGGELVWAEGSDSQYLSEGTIRIGNTLSVNEASIDLPPAITMIFNNAGAQTQLIYMNKANVVLGTIINEKTDGALQLHGNHALNLSGDLVIKPGCTFMASGKVINIACMLDIWNTGTFSPGAGTQMNTYNLYNSGLLNLSNTFTGSVNIANTFLQYPDGSLALHGGSLKLNKDYSGTNYSFDGTTNMSGGTLQITNNGMQIGSSGFNFSGGTIKLGWNFIANNPNTFRANQGTIELIGSRASSLGLHSSNYLPDLLISKTEATGTVNLGSDVSIKGQLSMLDGKLRINHNKLSVQSHLILSIDGYLYCDNADDELWLGKDWINNGGPENFIEGNGTVVFCGNWGHIRDSETFNNVRVHAVYSSPGLGGVMGDQYITINVLGNMEITAGKLQMSQESTLSVSGNMSVGGEGFHIFSNPGVPVSTVSIDGNLLVDDAELKLRYAELLLHGTLSTSPDSSIDLFEASLVNDAPYNGGWQDINSQWSIGSNSIVEFTHNSPRLLSGSEFGLAGEQGYGTLRTGRSFHAVYSGVGAYLSGGTIEFIGDATSQIYIGGGNTLPGITINKSNASVSLADAAIVTGNLCIENGVFNSNSFPLELHGHWLNYADEDAYLSGTSVLTLKSLFSSLSQRIVGNQTFYKLVINNISGRHSEIEDWLTVTNKLEVQSGGLILQFGERLYVMDDLSISENAYLKTGWNSYLYCYKDLVDLNPGARDAEEWGFLPHYSSNLILCGSSNQTLNFAASSVTTGNLVIDKPSGSFFPQKPINVMGNAAIVDGAWHGSSGLTHRFYQSLIISEGASFTDNSCFLLFEGDQNGSLTNDGYANFKYIIVNKSATLALGSDITMNTAGSITVNGGILDLGAHTLQTKGNLNVQTAGTLTIAAGGRLEMDNGSTLYVGDGGTLDTSGTALSPATISRIDGINYSYNILISGGTIAGEYTVYEYMGGDGIKITGSGWIDPAKSLNHCTFRYAFSATSHLTISNSQIITIDHAVFPGYFEGSIANVYKTNDQGSIQFTNEIGDWAGTLHENDPFNRVNWSNDIPFIMANPPSLSFGDVMWSQSSDYQGLIIQNSGSAMLTGNIQVPAGFSVVFARESLSSGSEWRSAAKGEEPPSRELLDFSVPAGGSRIYHVYFQPEAPIAYNTSLLITHNADSPPVNISLSGQGVGPVIDTNPGYFNVDLTPEESAIRTLEVINSGVDSLSIMAYVSSAMNPQVELLSCGFEGSFPPQGWNISMVHSSGSTPPQWFGAYNSPHLPEQSPHSGEQLAYFNSYNCQAGSMARLESTAFELTDINTPELSFWVYHDSSWSDRNDRIQVQVSTGSRTWTDLSSTISRYSPTQSGWQQHTLSLWEYQGQDNVQIGFLGISEYGNDIALDDVIVSGTYQLPFDWLQIDGDNMVMTDVPADSTLPLQISVDSSGIPSGWYYNTVNISSNDPVNPWLSIPFNVRVGTPDFELNPGYLGFPVLQVGETDSLDFEIVNTGEIGLVGSVTAPQNFRVEVVGGLRVRDANTVDFYAYPGIAASFRVFFSPTEAIDYQEQITINTNTGTPQYLPVYGSGVAIPIVETLPATAIEVQAATGHGRLISSGNLPITERGICWNTSGDPDLEDNHLAYEGSEDEFAITLSNLMHGTQYYVKAYVTNTLGTGYGEEQSFSTLWPTLVTSTDSLPDFGLVPVGEESEPQSFTISGNNLVDMVMLSSIGAFRIACHPDSAFGTEISLYTTGYVLEETPIYVKFIPSETGLTEDTIVPLTVGGGACDVSLSGTGVSTPTVETATVLNITSTSAEINSRITDDGLAPVTACGICVNTTGAPTLADPHTDEGAQDDWFSSLLTELEPNTWYFARSYAQNLAGAVYGNQVQFRTQMVPEICVNDSLLQPFGKVIVGETSPADSLSMWANQIIDDLLITAPPGFQISLDPMSREFSSELILTPEMGYIAPTMLYLRFAPTEGGNLSNQLTFSSTGVETYNLMLYGIGIVAPTVNTLDPAEITANSALGMGEIVHGGWSEITACGICYGLSPDPDLDDMHTITGTSQQDFGTQLEDLEGDTLYYIRAYATNAAGTAYGESLSFQTLLGHLDAPQNLIISKLDGQISLSWSAVIGANSYHIYRSADPYSEDWGESIGTTAELNWLDPAPGNAAFYKVLASSEIIE